MIHVQCERELELQVPADLSSSASTELYLDLLKKCLCRAIFEPGFKPVAPNSPGVRKVISNFGQRIQLRFGLQIVRSDQTSAEDLRPPGAKHAVEEYRTNYSITETMLPIDSDNAIGVFWRKRAKSNA